MHKILITASFIMLVNTATASTTVNKDIDTNTIWSKTGSPYIVNSDISVNATLRIQPGVTVKIAGNKYIMVKGNLYAAGTPTDSITITAVDTLQRWDKIWIKSPAKCSLKYCKIEYAGHSAVNNSSADSIYIGYNLLSNNVTDYCGGAIYNDGSAIVANNTISNNTAKYGGAGIYNDGKINIKTNIISNNSTEDTTSKGAGIFNNYTGNANITINTISNNDSKYIGGGICNKGTATIINNKIFNNTTEVRSGHGAGIYTEGTSTIQENDIHHNAANNGSGGGIFNYASKINITNNIIFDNTAGYNGGGIANHGEINATYNKIYNNNSCLNGGGIYNYNSAKITDNYIFKNIALKDGGGIYNYGEMTISENEEISDNTAENGGGICNKGTMSINREFLWKNSAQQGGGIYNYDSLNVRNTNICQNNATYGGSIYNSGSAGIIYNSIIDTTAIAIYNINKLFIRTNDIFATNCAVHNDTNNFVDAKYNFWNSTDTLIIKTKIYDFCDAPNKGLVAYVPFLKTNFSDTTAPDAPVNLRAKWINNSLFEISFTNPVDQSGISEYYYKLRKKGVNSPPSENFDTTGIINCLPDTFTATANDTILYVWLVDSSGNLNYKNNSHVFFDSIPPTITGTTVWHDTTEFWGPFIITTNIRDDYNIYTPLLCYRTNIDTNWVFDNMGYTSVYWYKDSIPAQVPQDSTRIDYYITVEDYGGNISTAPDSGFYSFYLHGQGIEENDVFPNKFQLFEPNPNPFASNTIIRYVLPEKSNVNLILYDLSGRFVSTLYSGIKEKGYYNVELKTMDIAAGIYFISLNTGKFKHKHKLVILNRR